MNNKAKIADKVATAILYITAVFFVLLLISMTTYIIYKGIIVIDKDSFGTGPNGIGTQLFNTVYLVFISLLITVPIGIFSGIYLSQYAKEGKAKAIIRTCVETLSSLPSIVVGLFGYYVFIIMTHSHWNLLAGALSLAILNVPLMTRVTEDAISNIPTKYRDGSLALGGTRWQTISHVLLPCAIPQIVTGIILAAGRGFGEAAVLMFTSGMSSAVNFNNWNPALSNSPLNVFRPADTLAVHIYALKTQSILPNAEDLANLSGMVLIILVAVFSIGSRFIGGIVAKRVSGE